MAQRFPLAFVLAAVLIGSAILAAVLPLAVYVLSGDSTPALDAFTWHLLSFTVLQAGLSVLFSVLPAIGVARALARRHFFGKFLVLGLFGVPLSLPVIVAILGASGWIGGWFPLYGLVGILIAHVFFNLPLATRFFLEALQSIPADQHRLAAQLGLHGWSRFRLLEWPTLMPAVIRVSILIFLLCASSFVIVLTLGGGPSASTLEVGIFQSLRMDFDLGRAVSLSVVQIFLSCFILLALIVSGHRFGRDAGVSVHSHAFGARSIVSRIIDAFIIGSATLFVALPIVAVVVSGLARFSLHPSVGTAAATSFVLATISMIGTILLAYALALKGGRISTVISLVGWIIPSAVVATGWFLAFGLHAAGVLTAASLIVALNVLLALPFCLTLIAAPVEKLAAEHGRLCQQLGVAGWKKVRIVDLPVLKRPLIQAGITAFVLSLGDLTAVTLLGAQGIITLPSLIAQQFGSYRGEAAASTALLLTVSCFALIAVAQTIGSRK
jgi:thiamine transport system permease protein